MEHSVLSNKQIDALTRRMADTMIELNQQVKTLQERHDQLLAFLNELVDSGNNHTSPDSDCLMCRAEDLLKELEGE